VKEIKFETDEIGELRAQIERLKRERDDAYAEVMEARACCGLDPFSTHGQLVALLRRVFRAGYPSTRENCPRPHRYPQGPNEDVGPCPGCGGNSWELRPEGETYGYHARDCSLPIRHEGNCVGGGSGHPAVVKIRGYFHDPEDAYDE
jgi:hypothetical protein